MLKVDVMWVGLSAKNDREGKKLAPLDKTSNSGKIIAMIESRQASLRFYRTNLVKHVPLDGNGKLRYPNHQEVESAIPNLIKEIRECRPKIIFLLGGQVSKALSNHIEREKLRVPTIVYEVYHPSYVYIYRRKQIEKYVDDISRKIQYSIL